MGLWPINPMTQYRRSYIPGGTFFFTVVTYNRQPILTSSVSRKLLREAWKTIQTKYPFELVACCLLPNHLHCIWTLPEQDSDYSIRWRGIKGLFSKSYKKEMNIHPNLSASKMKKREAGIWQRRFWEHTIFKQEDFNLHVDYIHYNPVKHGLVNRACDWPWSTFHRFRKEGVYDVDWGTVLSYNYPKIKDVGE
jgi:putative transposase